MKSEHTWLGGIAMTDYPRSPVSFQQRFPDETAGAAYLASIRWLDGFRRPACGHTQA